MVLNHIHSTIKWARVLRYQQIVGMGKFESKMNNSDSGNASFGEAKINDIMMMGSDVKENYRKYGLVVEILNDTRALIRAEGRIFKYPLYQLSPVLHERPGSRLVV